MPSISLITPVFNCADTLAHNLRSIAAQTRPCQHVIVDGASTDGTLDVIRREAPGDAIVISEPDRGMYDAINKGLQHATGDVIGILNADDYYPDETVLQQVARVFEDPAIDACYGDLLYVDRNDTDKVVRNWKSGDYDRKKFYNGWMPPHPTFFVRKRLYEQHGGYRLDLGSAADYEMMLRLLLRHEARAAHIPHVLVHMRNDGMSNASLKNRLRANRFDREAWRVNGVKPRPWTLAAKPLRKILQWM
jgi:glycosyltransferase